MISRSSGAPILPDDNHAAVILDGDQDDRRGMAHDLDLVLRPFGKRRLSTSTANTRP